MNNTNSANSTRDGRAWLVRSLTTLVMLPLLALDFVFIGLSPMATDSCGPDHCSQELTNALAAAPVLWLTAVVLLIASWALPSRTRFSSARTTMAALSLAAGVLTFAVLANLPNG
ncbi:MULTISPECIES: hypothetical protein [Streptomyces]|uniref:Transmembrane protein n=1 Tax=Streptomyces luteosporeus TaxID=173856 RepID=A0ABP6G0G5_9ACTN